MKLDVLKNEQFDIFYKILVDNFPKSERRTYKRHKEMLNNPLYKIFSYSEKSNILGMIGEWEFQDFLYIEHLAVMKNFHSKGIGTKMLHDFKLRFNKDIILEVEPPNTVEAVKRIDFYKKFGFKANDYKYLQPPMQEGQKNLPLIILSSDKKLDKEHFTKYREVLYKEVYKRRPI
ncbi:GNAT family N-acetyltransferase [Clostridium sp. BJN0001]|uniref:GNAT family N-acetyltransferase n=1 Tax=Clostridium sp. BJN0001 TaxID=2930219 RepID=UPI001FD58DC0|nr:GNAT family N-acetyltransferase [Clostridium sp. BJN0001]